MFYLKHRGTKVYIEDDNVYTRCIGCGKEIKVDLQEILGDGESDLYGTGCFCRECSEKRVFRRFQHSNLREA